MRKILALLAVSGLLIAMVAAPAGAKSDERPFKAFMTGEMSWAPDLECQPTGLHSYMDATGRVSHLGRSTLTGDHCTPPLTEYGPSEATLVAANGDEVDMIYHGVCPPLGDLNEGDVLECSFVFEIVDGTGRFDGADGEGIGTLSLIWAGHEPKTTAWWTWTGTIEY